MVKPRDYDIPRDLVYCNAPRLFTEKRDLPENLNAILFTLFPTTVNTASTTLLCSILVYDYGLRVRFVLLYDRLYRCKLTMTRKELPAQAANIQRAVASTTTCTSATVESLRSFLAPCSSPIIQRDKPITKVQPPKVKGSSARTVKATVSRAGKRPQVTVLEVSGEQIDRIQLQNKSNLATEIVNATLKSLTNAIKDPPPTKAIQPKRKAVARSSSSCSFSNGPESRSQTPLQPLCVNRLASSPGKQHRSRRSSSTFSIKQAMDGLRGQAECARIAFATLCSLHCHRDLSTALPHLQLESGMSALIGKALALGFDDIALKEIQVLKKRLEASQTTLAGQSHAASTDTWSDKEKFNLKTETLAGLLRFRNTNARGQLLSLIITTQLQVLKVLALRRDASATEAALQHLQFSTAHSPANLIRKQLEHDEPESEGKVARQLEALAQALIALCPIVSEEDGKSAGLGDNVSPDITFQIRALAFQVRSTWWQISGHQGNAAKEIVGPFTRCLAIYNGRSKSTKGRQYEIAKIALESIKACVQKMAAFREDTLSLAYQLLAESAQESSQYPDAIRWIRRAKESTRDCALSQVQSCNFKCRLASLELQLPLADSDDKLKILLRDAADSLDGDLQGESAELDELLLAVASLRRSAFSVFESSQRSSKVKEMKAQSALDHECSNIVFLCARFLVRYVGSSNTREGHGKTMLRRDQRRRLAARFATPTIESVVAIARLSAHSAAEAWRSVEIGLQDCLRLAASIADPSTNGDQTANEDKPTSPFLSISNAYWYRYQCVKREAKDAKSCRETLLLSIGPLRDRPSSEKRAGSLPLKLEKLGQLYEDVRDYEKAAQSYEEALHAELDSNICRAAVAAPTVQKLPDESELESELLPLSRKLSAYVNVASKAIDQGSRRQAFFDANVFSVSERGVLLERQLVSLLSTLSIHGGTSTTHHALNDISTSLLLMYEHDKFPVRRLRVVVRLLRSLLTAPGALENNLKDQLLEEPIMTATGSHLDLDLWSFIPHLLTCRCLLMTMRQKSPDVKDLESVLTSWSNMVQETLDMDSLQTQVYDIADWLILLEMLGEYLDMQGLELYRVSALNIAVVVHEAASSVQCSVLVSKLSELGSQHVRLGYSGLAGSVLHKAQRHLEASSVLGRAKLRWHLSYAEYALANGNFKTW